MKLNRNVVSLLLTVAVFSVTLFSCRKEQVVKTETITIVNTELVSDTATTFILIRHAETVGAGSNPGLSVGGQDRANELVTVLGNISLEAIFSTNYNRTTETASPVAIDQSLPVEIYNPSQLEAFVDTNIPIYKGKAILVVGHSNTTPDLLNILIGSNEYSTIAESEYDNMYIVTVYQKGNASVLHLKYGE